MVRVEKRVLDAGYHELPSMLSWSLHGASKLTQISIQMFSEPYLDDSNPNWPDYSPQNRLQKVQAAHNDCFQLPVLHLA